MQTSREKLREKSGTSRVVLEKLGTRDPEREVKVLLMTRLAAKTFRATSGLSAAKAADRPEVAPFS